MLPEPTRLLPPHTAESLPRKPAAPRPWQRLGFHIWVAVVVTIALLTGLFGWLWSTNTDHLPAPRAVLIRNEAGEVIGEAKSRPVRVPGQGMEIPVTMLDGSVLSVQLPPRPRNRGEPAPPRPWLRGPEALLWLLSIAAIAAAVGVYPIVRRLTQRLEALQTRVAQWGDGDLSVRIPETGNDEVALVAKRFNHAAERIEALVTSHRSMLANASHELRSPLARIRMAVELTAASPADMGMQEIRHSIHELDHLVDEILLARRLDARSSDMGPTEWVDMAGLASEECARTGADFQLLPPRPGGDLPQVEGSARMLRRLIRNLLENARRYGGDDVQLTLTHAQGVCELAVSDHGPGVPEAYRQRVFEPFFRLPGASEREGGVGLGLSLVQSIAERHGGQARCEPVQPHGARFVVTLPTSPSTLA
jgi:signal transduction histidine kinase